MSFSNLVERMVPLVAELFATLMQSDPLRMDFANIAKKTVYDIIGQLRGDGMTNEQIAEALDLSIAGFYKRVRELRRLYEEPSHDSTQKTFWEHIYEFVYEKTKGSPFIGVSYADVARNFHRVSDDRLRSALRYLVRYNLLMVSGDGPRAQYRIVPRERDEGVTYHDVVVQLYADGPLTLKDLADAVQIDEGECAAHIEQMRQAGKLHVLPPTRKGGDERYRAESFHIQLDADEGYEAALWDHFQAVCRTMCRKLRVGEHRASLADRNGGTTFTFDVPVEHELFERISTFLQDTRSQMDDWLGEVHALPEPNADERLVRITIYTGQMVEELDLESA